MTDFPRCDSCATKQIDTIRDWLDDALPPSTHLVDEQIRRDLWRKEAGTAGRGAWL